MKRTVKIWRQIKKYNADTQRQILKKSQTNFKNVWLVFRLRFQFGDDSESAKSVVS
jgi:hypothetical protein